MILLLLACHPSDDGKAGPAETAGETAPTDPPVAYEAELTAPDDAGDVAFVYAATSAVLGRPVHGEAEAQVLLDLVATRGRAGMLEALYEEPDYIGYWTRVLTRDFEIDYEASVSYGDFSLCTSHPVLFAGGLNAADAERLSDHLVNDPSITTIPLTWNMTDAMMASLHEDNLLGTFRLWVLTRLAWMPAPAGDRRAWVLANSLIHRPEQCAACHNSTWSAPDAGVDPTLESYGWDRSWPTPLNLDGDVFGGDQLIPLDESGGVACDEADRGCVVYRDRCSGCHGADARTPVGSGAVDSPPVYRNKVLRDRIPILHGSDIQGVALDGSGRMPSVLSRETEAEDAVAVADWLQARFGRREDLVAFLNDVNYQDDGTTPFGIDDACNVAIRAGRSGGEAVTFAGVTTTAPSPFLLADALLDGQVALANATALDLTATSDASVTDRRIGGAAAFTWMSAESVVDNLYEELYGDALSTTNGVPRNPVQGAARAAATARFLESGWSLRGLLTETLLSQYFNRAAPASSALAEPYPMSMVVNPWADTHREPDGTTGEARNGTGDLVHRRSPDQAQFAAARALGWPAPAIAPDPTAPVGWDSVAFQAALGSLTGTLQRGEDTWTTESLLYWESVVGRCNADGTFGHDWVDALLLAAAGDPTLTTRDLLESVRGRIIGVSALSPGETEAFATVTSLDSLVADDPEGVATLTRAWCGALLTSPQFLMTGIPVATTLGAPARLVVGYGGEPVTHGEWCRHYAEGLASAGIEWSCSDAPGE